VSLHQVPDVFLYLLGVIAVVGMGCGTALAVTGYSSAGAFSIAAACVGVLGTLAARPGEKPPDSPEVADP
jgi:uncharacterized membrane protein YjjB (DUF3815 family)